MRSKNNRVSWGKRGCFMALLQLCNELLKLTEQGQRQLVGLICL